MARAPRAPVPPRRRPCRPRRRPCRALVPCQSAPRAAGSLAMWCAPHPARPAAYVRRTPLVSPDLASLTCACRCSLARAVGVGLENDDRVGAGGLAGARLPQLVRGAGGGIVRAAQRAQERLGAGQPCQNTVASKAAHGPCPSPLSRSGPPPELWRGAQANAPPQGHPAGRKAAAFDPPGWVAPSTRHSRAGRP